MDRGYQLSFMLKNVEIPPHVFHGIRPLMGSTPLPANLCIFGGDTETVRGHIHTIQIAGPEDSTVIFVDEHTVLPEFWGWIKHRLRSKGVNLCYFHNLNFDLRVMFSLWHKVIYEQFHDIRFIALDTKGQDVVEVEMLFGKVNACKITQGPLKLEIYDSKAFTTAGLARSLKMFQINQGKLAMPEGLGTEYLRTPEFKAYALQDVVAVRALGLRIMEFHEHYAIRPAVTLPAFTARVFRRHFMKPDQVIPFPPPEVVRAAELSYHGGKNGYYLRDGEDKNRPAIVEDVYEMDISSAYPHAMRSLPALTIGEYAQVDRFMPGYFGLYRISGKDSGDLYPLIYDSAFDPIPRGASFSDLWITSWEMEHILRSGISVDKIMGYVWVPGDKACNPFADFVDHFYAKKQATPKTDPYYHLFKIVLNSLYGKLVATVPIKSMEEIAAVKELQAAGVDIPDSFVISERYDPVKDAYVRVTSGWRAGLMYNPFWASAITGHTRAYIYELEKKCSAIHTATDSVKSTRLIPKVPGLGGLNTECFGRCYLFRNKLYLHCSKGFDFCGHDPKNLPYKYPVKHPRAGEPMIDHDGQHLCKLALHGFKGQIWELWDNRHKLIKDRSITYTHTHVVGLREGLRTGQTPCNFVDRTETLSLNG
jgi:hypothetical protein